ncbi:MAG: RluA family pseudouridine synthase [Puniceicoccales bacterium]|jgi:23S rRNA pseudouridine1911/1915/1917 synthase|nr:RluA family pseudouridine synthase [Puniceicoccales bacterium]
MNPEKEPHSRCIEVPPLLSGERADKMLAACLPHFSRTKLQILFKEGKVFHEGIPIAAKERLSSGKILEIKFPLPGDKSKSSMATSEIVPLEILFEDEDILVISKASGIVVHPGNGACGSTLVEHIAHFKIPLSAAGDADRPGVVHRLDKETSGAVVLAKTDFAHQALTNAFSARNILKIYTTLVRGTPSCLSGSIRQPIGRHPVHRTRMCVSQEGRPARSDWKVLETFGGQYSHVQVQIFTGRTHQIRIHMQHLGFPILGDKTYGYRVYASDPCSFNRVMLHAHQLEIPHPVSGQRMAFFAPLAIDFQEKLDFLRSHFHHP